MPVYLYLNPKTKKVIEVVQKMNDKHEYFDGPVKCHRVLIPSAISIDGRINPFSSQDFVDKTKKKNIKYGELLDMSKELSEKRAAKTGEDPVKRAALDKYKKKIGKPHPEDLPKRIETKDYVVEF